MIRCDEEGIPKIIQSMIYDQAMMAMEVVLFNGERAMFDDVFQIRPGRSPGASEYRDAERNIETFLIANWQDFPWSLPEKN